VQTASPDTAAVGAGNSVVRLTSKKAVLRRAAKGHGTLTVTIKAASAGAKFTQVQIGLPRGLRFISSAKKLAHALRVTGPHGAKLSFKVGIKHGALRVTFKHPQSSATLVIGSAALTVNAQFTSKHSKKTKNVSLILTAASTHKTTRAQLVLRVES
jgi:hypothetical protein